jgi:hypothetical protein
MTQTLEILAYKLPTGDWAFDHSHQGTKREPPLLWDRIGFRSLFSGPNLGGPYCREQIAGVNTT